MSFALVSFRMNMLHVMLSVVETSFRFKASQSKWEVDLSTAKTEGLHFVNLSQNQVKILSGNVRQDVIECQAGCVIR